MTVRQIGPGALQTVVEVLEAAADLHGELEAYVEPAVTGTVRAGLTFREWDRAAEGVAGLLAAQGVTKGDVVALLLPSSIDYAVCYAAAMRLGAITSGINPRLGPAERASILDRAKPSCVVLDPVLGIAETPSGAAVIGRPLVHDAFDGPGPPRRPVLGPHDAVAVVWTSGTTGRPKGAVFDHANLEAVAAGTDVLSHPGDRRLSPLPFAHVGYMTRAWDEIAHGITTVITPTPWRAAEALAILESERITVAQGVPTQWALILELDALATTDLRSLRIAGTGAARMAAEHVRALGDRLGVPVVVRYTSTEASLGTGTVPGDPPEVVATTVGRPVPGVELRLVADDESPAAEGEVGRVWLRSGAVMRGYWADRFQIHPDEPDRGSEQLVDAEATSVVVDEDGWVRTGDFGRLDALGNLTLIGRDNELYIRGGYNVLPAEVESVLLTHRAIGDVAVVGAPDPVMGEVGVAFVVLDPSMVDGSGPDLDELRRLCKSQLADYKAPDALVFLDALPLTAMMKVDRRALGALAATVAAERSGPVGSARAR